MLANDECFTLDSTWDDLLRFLPRDRVLYDPFNGERFVKWATKNKLSAVSGNDFWRTPLPVNGVVVSNPPFTCRAEVLETLVEADYAFVLLLPFTTLRMNIMNALTGAKMVFWGKDQKWMFDDGQLKRARMFALINHLPAPAITWIRAPLKQTTSCMCECGTKVQTHHRKFHEQQQYHRYHKLKGTNRARRASW